MLDSLITSKTRIKLLIKFFINSNTQSYLRSLAEEFNEYTNSVRIELNRLSEAGILEAHAEKNTIVYQANQKHPLFPEISNIVRKYIGFDQIMGEIIEKLGDLKLAFIIGDYAEGKDTGVIDLIVVGDINQLYLIGLINKAEGIIKRKIRYLILTISEYEKDFKDLSGQKVLIF